MQLCRPTDLQHAERIERLQGLQGLQGLQSLITLRGDYRDVEIPADACVYADPPYADSQKYGSEKREDFDIDGFWQWCRERPFPVFVSEYAAPDDFRSLYSVALNSTLSATNNARKRLEHLFVHERFYNEMQWLVPRQQLLF
jgi:site-specific DNA-adenine methylase